MIAETDAFALLEKNLDRTEMLITAMEKIKAYNSLYQMQQQPPDNAVVKSVQDTQLKKIEQSCGEHAIISLTTAFETYYKELLQQLLCDYPNYFLPKSTDYSVKVKHLIEAGTLHTYEDIVKTLGIRNRHGFYSVLTVYSIPLLSDEEEQFIEHIYARRNSYVHNAGRVDAKTQRLLAQYPAPFDESVLPTEVKKLRTNFRRIMSNAHNRVISSVI